MATSNPYLYIVPGLVYIEVTVSSFDFRGSDRVFISNAYYRLAAAKEAHRVVADAVNPVTMQIQHVTNGTTPGAGTNQLTASLNLNAAVDTIQTGSLIGSPTILAPNDSLCVVVTGTIGINFSGNLTLYLEKMRRWNSLLY